MNEAKKNYNVGTRPPFMAPFVMPGDMWMSVDERKARRIVRKLLKEGGNIVRAELGLDGDWDWNSSIIYEDSKFSTYAAYHGSRWATPILMIYFMDAPSEAHECYKYEEEEKLPEGANKNGK